VRVAIETQNDLQVTAGVCCLCGGCRWRRVCRVMGKCLSCVSYGAAGARGQPQHSSSTQLQQQHIPLTQAEHHRTPQQSNSANSLNELHRSTYLQPSDTHSNGSGKNANFPTSTSSEKRSFYHRLPPLTTMSASTEIRRLSSKDYSETKINSLFDHYKDPNCDAILSEGIEKFCFDLDVRPEEFKVLVLAWKFGAETMCCFTRKEFVNGCKALHVDSIKGIQSKFPEMLNEVKEYSEKFKDLYRFTFRFGLDSEIDQRILPSDMASVLWKLVFSQQEPNILKRWLTFLERHPNIRGIPRDTWNMFLNFTETVGDDLSCYDDTEAWPSLFDDFVEYENDRLNQNISEDPEDEMD